MHHSYVSFARYLKQVEHGCRHEEGLGGRKAAGPCSGWEARAWLAQLSYLHLREQVLEEPGSTAWEGTCLHKEERSVVTGDGGRRGVGTESAVALWEPRECMTGLSSTSLGATPKSGGGMVLGTRTAAVTAGLRRLESCVLVPFQHHNFSPLKATFKNACTS